MSEYQFTRQLAKEATNDIRREFPGIKVARAGITGGPKQYFFQFIQDGFPSLEIWVKAYDRYEARAKGWWKYLETHFALSESARLAKLAEELK